MNATLLSENKHWLYTATPVLDADAISKNNMENTAADLSISTT